MELSSSGKKFAHEQRTKIVLHEQLIVRGKKLGELREEKP